MRIEKRLYEGCRANAEQRECNAHLQEAEVIQPAARAHRSAAEVREQLRQDLPVVEHRLAPEPFPQPEGCWRDKLCWLTASSPIKPMGMGPKVGIKLGGALGLGKSPEWQSFALVRRMCRFRLRYRVSSHTTGISVSFRNCSWYSADDRRVPGSTVNRRDERDSGSDMCVIQLSVRNMIVLIAGDALWRKIQPNQTHYTNKKALNETQKKGGVNSDGRSRVVC